MLTILPITESGKTVRILDRADLNCGPDPRILGIVEPAGNFGSWDPATGVADAGEIGDNLRAVES